jgi:hypothetical protein
VGPAGLGGPDEKDVRSEEREAMKILSWRSLAGLLVGGAFFLGCTLQPMGAEAPLNPAQVQETLNRWNPSYCKVAEFYGLYQPEAGGSTRLAYVSLVNPNDPAQKPAVYEAKLQLLSRTDGRQQWYLTSLITHGSGFLTRRQGWDNLMIPLQKTPAATSKK